MFPLAWLPTLFASFKNIMRCTMRHLDGSPTRLRRMHRTPKAHTYGLACCSPGTRMQVYLVNDLPMRLPAIVSVHAHVLVPQANTSDDARGQAGVEVLRLEAWAWPHASRRLWKGEVSAESALLTGAGMRAICSSTRLLVHACALCDCTQLRCRCAPG